VLATLLGELPALNTLCRRKIASRAGLAPTPAKVGHGAGPDASGADGARSAKPSTSPPSTSRRIPVLTAMRDRTRAKGKTPKTILIAVARQLLVILNAMIRKRQPIALG
jgi:transposase